MYVRKTSSHVFKSLIFLLALGCAYNCPIVSIVKQLSCISSLQSTTTTTAPTTNAASTTTRGGGGGGGVGGGGGGGYPGLFICLYW